MTARPASCGLAPLRASLRALCETRLYGFPARPPAWPAGRSPRTPPRPGPDPHFMRAIGSRPNAPVGDALVVRHARNAVYAVFFSAGFIYASWASRIPQVRAELAGGRGVLGLGLGSGAG